MGKNKIKRYVLLSGFKTNDSNRGTAALGYGAISFMYEKGILDDKTILVLLTTSREFWNCRKSSYIEEMNLQNKKTTVYHLCVFSIEVKLFILCGFYLPFTAFGKLLLNLKTVAAINGGDGFSDIYSTKLFENRLTDTMICMRNKSQLIILPQTIGPFNNEENYRKGLRILKYAYKVYVRDKQFIDELDKNNISYEVTKDLSAYMKPEPWDINIRPNSVGINISGLAYYNNFPGLEGQFNSYPDLIDRVIALFQNKEVSVYLIPHSYNYSSPEPNNDDMTASRNVFEKLKDKKGVFLIDKDLISPQVKYVISRMSFFVGTRMHANFAAIYSGVPVFGLAYSYKFEGAFEANGQSKEQVALINNVTKGDIEIIVNKIEKYYKSII